MNAALGHACSQPLREYRIAPVQVLLTRLSCALLLTYWKRREEWMLLVETDLRPSSIPGIGVFLLQPVSRGELIWRFDTRVDRVYTEEEFATLPEPMKRLLRPTPPGMSSRACGCFVGDNGRHFNHSVTPTTLSNAISFGEDRAADDLSIGTELTSDYSTICDHVHRNGHRF